MKKQLNDQAAENYASPSCEEIPVGTEGPLCASVGNETVGETDGEW